MSPNDDGNRLVLFGEQYRCGSSDNGRANGADRCRKLDDEQLKYTIFFMTYHAKT